MKVLVCGGRDYADRRAAFAYLDGLHQLFVVSQVIEGGARGADRLGKEWAESRAIPIRTFRAKWDEHGRGAGHIRNGQMLAVGKPDAVVAFPGGRGTADMVRRAEQARVPVFQQAVGG